MMCCLLAFTCYTEAIATDRQRDSAPRVLGGLVDQAWQHDYSSVRYAVLFTGVAASLTRAACWLQQYYGTGTEHGRYSSAPQCRQ